MNAIVHAADIQDRDGGVLLMATLFGLYPFLLKLYADADTKGRSSRRAWPGLSRSECRDCSALRRRQVRRVAQTLDRGTHHRLAEPVQAAEQGLGVPERNALAFLRWASVRLMLRRLCQT
jgi:hypothetical protein